MPLRLAAGSDCPGTARSLNQATHTKPQRKRLQGPPAPRSLTALLPHPLVACPLRRPRTRKGLPTPPPLPYRRCCEAAGSPGWASAPRPPPRCWRRPAGAAYLAGTWGRRKAASWESPPRCPRLQTSWRRSSGRGAPAQAVGGTSDSLSGRRRPRRLWSRVSSSSFCARAQPGKGGGGGSLGARPGLFKRKGPPSLSPASQRHGAALARLNKARTIQRSCGGSTHSNLIRRD